MPTTALKPSKSFEEAKAMLPEELHDTFERLVRGYQFHLLYLTVRNSRRCTPDVLAALVKEGWRLPVKEKMACTGS